MARKRWQKRISKAVRALQGKPLREAGALLGDPDDHLSENQGGSRYYTPVTQRNPKDLQPLEQQQMLQIAHFLYVSNPLARRILERRTNFILGEGVAAASENEAKQAVIDDFWNDSRNRIDKRLHGWCNGWRGYGELVLRATVNPVSGKVRLGFISPDAIDTVESDPEDAEEQTYVVLKADPGEEAERLKIIREDEDPDSPTFGQLVGDCFYWGANRLPDMTRGVSDLLPIADYLGAYESFSWSRVERANLVNAVVWLITKKGMDQDELDEWWRQHGSPPKHASVIAKNEEEEWELLVPKLEAADAASEADLILATIASGAGLPKYWLNAQDDPNRSSAEQMAGPVLKDLTELQREFVGILAEILRFVLDRAIQGGVLRFRKGASRREFISDFYIEVPDLNPEDVASAGNAFDAAMRGVVAARSEKVVDLETARRLVAVLMTQFGVRVDLEDMTQRLEEEMKKEEEAALVSPYPADPGAPSPAPPAGPGPAVTEAIDPKGLAAWEAALEEHGSHNQKDHGNWAKGRAAGTTSESPAKIGRSSLLDGELSRAGRRTEQLAIHLPDGRLLFQKAGTDDNVPVSASERAELQMMGNAIATHNHPVSGVSFSEQDVKFAIRNDLAEIRVIGEYAHDHTSRDWSMQPAGRAVLDITTPELQAKFPLPTTSSTHLYALRRPNGGWPRDAARRIESIRAEIKQQVLEDVARQRVPWHQANRVARHRMWQRFAQETGASYGWFQVDGLTEAILAAIFEHGSHNQKDHGNWAKGGGAQHLGMRGVLAGIPVWRADPEAFLRDVLEMPDAHVRGLAEVLSREELSDLIIKEIL